MDTPPPFFMVKHGIKVENFDVAQGRDGSALVTFSQHGRNNRREERTVEFFVAIVAGIWAGITALAFCMPGTRK